MVFIGITGKNCAGKDTIAAYLVKKGFVYYSLSDAIREILKERQIAPTRENLIFYANKLREENGANFFAKKVVEKIDLTKNGVIVSIRNLAEVNELKKLPNFILLIVESEPHLRFERMKKRARDGDPKTFEEFIRLEKMEENNSPTSQQLLEVLKVGDFYISNNTTIEELHYKIDKFLEKIKK
ncbi:MAG: AAA family ATPase [Candidatus Micrarchaeota archaeon]|nr:AAA family ATPase [Candidatus Micrarchaeota archaeon]